MEVRLSEYVECGNFSITCLPHKDLTCCVRSELQVVEGLDPFKSLPPEKWGEKGRPVVLLDEDCAIFMANQFCMIDGGRFVHNPGQIIQTTNFRPLEKLLEEAKRPVWCELGVAHKHEAHLNLAIKATPDTPGEVLHDKPRKIVAK